MCLGEGEGEWCGQVRERVGDGGERERGLWHSGYLSLGLLSTFQRQGT